MIDTRPRWHCPPVRRCAFVWVALVWATPACAPGPASDTTETSDESGGVPEPAPPCPACTADWALGHWHWQGSDGGHGPAYPRVVNLELRADGSAHWSELSCREASDQVQVQARAAWHPTADDSASDEASDSAAIVPLPGEPSFTFWGRSFTRWDLSPGLDHAQAETLTIQATLFVAGQSAESFETMLLRGARCLDCEAGTGEGYDCAG